MYYIQERWKIIEETDGRYSISDHGRLRHERTGRVWRGGISSNGYFTLTIHGSRAAVGDAAKRSILVHRLVAMAFVEGFSEGLQVNHKDGNKTNNIWTNLEWVTGGENMAHAHRHGLLRGGVAGRSCARIPASVQAEVYRRVVDLGESQRLVSGTLGVSRRSVQRIIRAPRPVVPQGSLSLFTGEEDAE